MSVEKLPATDWPMGKSVRRLIDGHGRAKTIVGSAIPRHVDLLCVVKQGRQASKRQF